MLLFKDLNKSTVVQCNNAEGNINTQLLLYYNILLYLKFFNAISYIFE